jgi:hypothetical protein
MRSATDALAETLLDWGDNPVRFVNEALGATPEAWQAEALLTIAESDRLAVRSGHGVGKTTFLCWLILWWGLTRPNSKIGITAPAAPQIDAALWPDLKKWRTKLRDTVPGVGQILASWVEIKSDQIVFPGGNMAVARTARPDQPEALQGLHAENLLFLIDEASGVSEAVFEASQGALSTPGAKIVMTGNPTRTQGFFHDAFHRSRAYWSTMRVSSEDVSADRVDRKFIEEIAGKYGRDSNVYRVRVMGDFPTSEDDVVIPLHLCEAAVSRDVAIAGRRVIWGVDVARFGSDKSALAKRNGNTLIEPVRTWHGLDTMQLSGQVMREYLDAEFKPDVIAVDVIGVGAGVVDRLIEMGLPATGVNVAESPAVEPARFVRLRDELWFACRDWLAARDVRMPDDADTIAELTAVKYKLTSAGKILVESKDEMKRRGMPSPDRADAVVLTFAQSDLASQQMSYQPPVYFDS